MNYSVDHKECYGSIFPKVKSHTPNNHEAGKVFKVDQKKSGGLWSFGEKLDVDIEEWDDCLQCHEFEACYKLSSAKFLITRLS